MYLISRSNAHCLQPTEDSVPHNTPIDMMSWAKRAPTAASRFITHMSGLTVRNGTNSPDDISGPNDGLNCSLALVIIPIAIMCAFIYIGCFMNRKSKKNGLTDNNERTGRSIANTRHDQDIEANAADTYQLPSLPTGRPLYSTRSRDEHTERSINEHTGQPTYHQSKTAATMYHAYPDAVLRTESESHSGSEEGLPSYREAVGNNAIRVPTTAESMWHRILDLRVSQSLGRNMGGC